MHHEDAPMSRRTGRVVVLVVVALVVLVVEALVVVAPALADGGRRLPAAPLAGAAQCTSDAIDDVGRGVLLTASRMEALGSYARPRASVLTPSWI